MDDDRRRFPSLLRLLDLLDDTSYDRLDSYDLDLVDLVPLSFGPIDVDSDEFALRNGGGGGGGGRPRVRATPTPGDCSENTVSTNSELPVANVC